MKEEENETKTDTLGSRDICEHNIMASSSVHKLVAAEHWVPSGCAEPSLEFATATQKASRHGLPFAIGATDCDLGAGLNCRS